MHRRCKAAYLYPRSQWVKVWPVSVPRVLSQQAPGGLNRSPLTYLYPFLRLPAGWFGMVGLQLLLLPRRSARDVSTCSGASHLRSGRPTHTKVGRWVIRDKPSFRYLASPPPPLSLSFYNHAIPRAACASRSSPVLRESSAQTAARGPRSSSETLQHEPRAKNTESC